MIILMMFATAAMINAALAQSSFTCQGQLKQPGQLLFGIVNMEFALYDVLAGGTPALVTPKAEVSVSDGLFQVELQVGDLDMAQIWYVEARVTAVISYNW